MARKLKAFTTSAGFFDLAVSAPSMKAALEAWGAGANLFHQGFARQTDDAAIVEATMAHPGIVLRRPVGSDETFTDEAEASGAAFEGKVARTSRPARPRSCSRTRARPLRGSLESRRVQARGAQARGARVRGARVRVRELRFSVVAR